MSQEHTPQLEGCVRSGAAGDPEYCTLIDPFGCDQARADGVEALANVRSSNSEAICGFVSAGSGAVGCVFAVPALLMLFSTEELLDSTSSRSG